MDFLSQFYKNFPSLKIDHTQLCFWQETLADCGAALAKYSIPSFLMKIIRPIVVTVKSLSGGRGSLDDDAKVLVTNRMHERDAHKIGQASHLLLTGRDGAR